MFVKKFKKKCGVRGCKNISDVFIISRRREMGNTIAMCRECMADALKATEGYAEEAKVKKPIAPLFPHPEIKEDVTLSSVADEIEEPKPKEVIEDVTEDVPISVAEDTVTVTRELDKLTDAELHNLGMHRDEKGEQGEIGLPNITKTTTTPTKKAPQKKTVKKSSKKKK